MPENKVTFGISNMHVAFLGQAQTGKIEVTNPPSTDGEITLQITADTLLGVDSPASVVIPLASETHTNAAKVASAIVNVLNNDDVINEVFRVWHNVGVVYLATKVAQTDDATLSISFTDTGVTGATMGTYAEVADGTTGYGNPKAVDGTVSLTTTPEGDENTFYADNTKYYISTTNNGYTGDWEAAKLPKDILAEMVGMIIDNDGALVEDADGKQKEFALMGQFEGDDHAGRFVYYRCKSSRPGQNSSTTDSGVTPDTNTAGLTMLPYEYDGKKIVKKTIEKADNEAVYNSFFDAVSMPNFAA
jgi:phi13 family phage major tail protein